LAAALGFTPFLSSARASSALLIAVGFRPLYLPSRFALAIPSRCAKSRKAPTHFHEIRPPVFIESAHLIS